uniref:Uncharacterized protein n=1 Tax=Nelumbo nucifera TaxID=4432 RepID=A0A822XV53_NELNU|nr:TPA_asm: hypothetical protein HUJ06_024289 [Nelumbo nucifera]
MAPSIRKAIGAVKDQTNIGLAKVASNTAPDLEVAIVKATSHDDDLADEKNIRENLTLTSYSRGYVNAWIASCYRVEAARGTRLLNMFDFCDEAHSNSWDHSAFVWTYALLEKMGSL